MSYKKYLDIDSNFRNRELYPNQADFVVKYEDFDEDVPFDNTPITYWNCSFSTDTDVTGEYVRVTVQDITTNDGIVTINISSSLLRQETNFYNGAICKLNFTSISQPIPRYKFLIKDLTLTSTTEGVITLEIEETVNLDDVATIDILNPTNDTKVGAKPKLFIPNGSGIDNFYSGYFVHEIGSREYRTIVDYDGVTKLATLDSNTSYVWVGILYNIILFKKRANEIGFIAVTDALNFSGGVSSDRTKLQFGAGWSSTQYGIHDGKYLRLIDPLISSELTPPPFGERYKISKYVTLNTTWVSVAAGGKTFTLSEGIEDYTGLMITDLQTISTRTIVSYDTSTKSGTVDINWPAGILAGTVCYILTAVLEKPLSAAITIVPLVLWSPATYVIEEESIDNRQTVKYDGPYEFSNKPIPYEISLEHLILPNVDLVKRNLCNYPYLYVRLENLKILNRNNTLFWSNNPNSRSKLFRVVINDVKSQEKGNFIFLNSGKMVQNMLFNLKDGFRFTIYFPNGEIYQTKESDESFPLYSNPMLQISALFSFKKV